MRAKTQNGELELDAEFDLAFEEDTIRITLHSRGGSDPGKRANPDYELALQVLLERLSEIGSSLHGVYLASRPVALLPPSQRRLDLADFSLPVELEKVERLVDLRLAIRRAVMKAHSRSTNAGHGNSTKRIEIVASCPLEPYRAAEYLEWGSWDAVEESDVAERIERGFSEGNLILRTHLLRERNRALVSYAKASFKAKHGRLFCEICGFDFGASYGELGADFIEAHHESPLSERSESAETRPSDLRMVCSNCHRMLHRSGRATVETLRAIIAGL